MSEFFDRYITQFPEKFRFSFGDAIDNAVKEFSGNHKESLRAIRGFAITIVSGIQNLLNAIPWIIIIVFVALLAWRLTKKPLVGVLYGFMLFFIGCCGLWSEMTETLSIVISGVVLCILLGFPLGVLLTLSKRANAVIRPILDTMQTMPSWVYLVPSVILFGVGITPALLATTIYAIVPMVRLTCLGLLGVDHEMLEAARAFGSTEFQTLRRVRIPQAISTIMTGVNQTIMMAVSMVVTCSMIGANGLGMEILVAVNRVEMGKALFPGICIVILAVILDRLMQAAVRGMEARHDG